MIRVCHGAFGGAHSIRKVCVVLRFGGDGSVAPACYVEPMLGTPFWDDLDAFATSPIVTHQSIIAAKAFRL
jgi:hypothetical protein